MFHANKKYDDKLERNTAMDDRLSQMLEAKWHKLVHKIEDPWVRRTQCFLLENQAGYIASKLLAESTGTVNVPDFVKYVFPMIRRVWPNLIANDLVSVQPMTAAIGGIFYFEYKAGTTKGSITAGDNLVENFDRYYTSSYVFEHQIGALGSSNYTGTVPFFPVQPYSTYRTGIEFTSSVAATPVRIYDGDGTGNLQGDEGAASTIVYATGVYDVTFTGNTDAAVKVSYFCDMEAKGANVPEIYADISLTPIKAQNRKLKMIWSSEAADDFKSMVGIDAGAQLVAGGSSEMRLETDREMIMDMYGSNTTYTGTFDATVPAGINAIDHYSNILTKMNKISNQIFTGTNRGPANWQVVGSDVSNIVSQLEKHGDFKSVFTLNPAPVGQGTGGRPSFDLPRGPTGYGIYQLGLLQSRWAVYLDPLFPANKSLLGLKGPTPWDAGYVYAPYVPFQLTGTFMDPGDFTSRRGMRTRYSKKVVDNKYYGILTVTNAP
jgi:hypothetical protein